MKINDKERELRKAFTWAMDRTYFIKGGSFAMKRSWAFFLVFAVVVFVFSPAALASPFDGTWRLESATLDELYGDERWTGNATGTTPNEFKVIITTLDTSGYAMWFNYTETPYLIGLGEGVNITWAISPPGGSAPSASYRIYDLKRLFVNKLSETEYVAIATGDMSCVLTDNSTMKITHKLTGIDPASTGNIDYEFNYEYIFKRVGGTSTDPTNPTDPTDPDPGTGSGNGGGGGGCSTFGLGFGIFVLIGGLLTIKKKR